MNMQKHGVSFYEAKTILYDDYAKIIYDREHSNEEDRFILLGMSLHSRILTVCHCYRKKDEIIRIISARKATRNEARQYKEGVQ